MNIFGGPSSAYQSVLWPPKIHIHPTRKLQPLHSKNPKDLIHYSINFKSQILSKSPQFNSPKSHHLKWVQVRLWIWFTQTHFLSICRPEKLKKNITCSYNTMMGQVQDKLQIFWFKKGGNGRRKGVTTPNQSGNSSEQTPLYFRPDNNPEIWGSALLVHGCTSWVIFLFFKKR